MKLLFWLHFWTALGDTITISLREKRVVNRTLHWTSGTHFSSTIWQQLVHDMSSFWGGHRQNMNIALWWRRSVVSACRNDEKDALSSIPTTGHSWIALHCTTIGNYSYVGSIVSWSWCYAYITKTYSPLRERLLLSLRLPLLIQHFYKCIWIILDFW